MTDASRICRDYLVPPQDCLWEWRDQGEVAVWADGRTIVFRAELAKILSHLAPRGLPPLGAILLLLAAARNNWGESETEAEILAGCIKRSNEAWSSVDALYRVIAGLTEVHRLEKELRTSTEAKCILCEVVFERSPGRTSPEDATFISECVAAGIRDLIAERADSMTWWRDSPRVVLQDLRCLQLGLRRVDPEVLRLRRQTGLDALPRTTEFQIPPALQVRSLLTELKKDSELSGLAQLALNLMAAIAVPRPVTEREELQLGGVSDISNRGPLDRLLLSELAHDDLTLAVRVAVNEALYLRRESPPRTPPRQRTILLDAGIRTWGVPRVFVTAVGLAMAAAAEPDTEITVFRGSGAGVEPVDLTTRDGLVSHLEALESDLHLGSALEAFHQRQGSSERQADPIVVTTEDSLQDAEFQQLLSECPITPLYLATVERDGRFSLFERTPRGCKPIKESLLELDQLFESPADVVPSLIDREWARDLPAIISVAPFPLLLSHNVDASCVWRVEDRGLLALARDRRLMFWTDVKLGAYQMTDAAPAGRLWWFSSQPMGGTVRAVVGSAGIHGVHLLQIDLDGLRCISSKLDIERGLRAICAHGSVLFAVYDRRVQVFGQDTGEPLQTISLPAGMTWQRGRFFQGNRGASWYALCYDGRAARLEPVLEEGAVGCPRLLTLLDCVGVDGPVGVTPTGDVYLTSTRKLRKVQLDLPKGVQIQAVSPDGRRVAVTSNVPIYPQVRVINTDTLSVDTEYHQPYYLLQADIHDYVRPTNIRNRFTHVGVTSDGMLALTSRKRVQLGIDYDASLDRIHLHDCTDADLRGPKLSFCGVSTSASIGFRLTVARWRDGSAAFLDSRGLLHLRSSDTELPEMSIVLTDGEMAGWSSDGRFWGSRYFTGAQRLAPMRDVFETQIKAFVARLP